MFTRGWNLCRAVFVCKIVELTTRRTDSWPVDQCADWQADEVDERSDLLLFEPAPENMDCCLLWKKALLLRDAEWTISKHDRNAAQWSRLALMTVIVLKWNPGHHPEPEMRWTHVAAWPPLNQICVVVRNHAFTTQQLKRSVNYSCNHGVRRFAEAV